MELHEIEFIFHRQKGSYIFDDRITEISDKKIIKHLLRPSTGIFKSFTIVNSIRKIQSNTLINFKIHFSNSVSFLVRFDPLDITNEDGEKLMEEINKLDTLADIDAQRLKVKIEKLLIILIKYKPLFATITRNGDIKINTDSLNIVAFDIGLNFPILVLKTKKKIKIDVEQSLYYRILKFYQQRKARRMIKRKDKKGPEEVEFETKDTDKSKKVLFQKYITKLFSLELPLTLIFSLLIGFSISMGLYETYNKNKFSIIFFLLSIIYLIVLSNVWSSEIVKEKNKSKNISLYFIASYMLVGVSAGVVLGIFASKSAFNNTVEGFKIKEVIGFSIPLSLIWVYMSVPIGIVFSFAIPALKEKLKMIKTKISKKNKNNN